MKQVDVEYILNDKKIYEEFKGMKEAKEFIRKIKKQGAIIKNVYGFELNYN